MRPKSILYQMQDAEHRWELSGISSPEDKHENNEIWHLERHQKYGATIGLGFAPLFLCDWKMKQWSAPPPAFAPNGFEKPFGDYGLASQPQRSEGEKRSQAVGKGEGCRAVMK